MNDDRLRIPQDSEYFQAIGLAAVCFARLEWDVAYCCERLESGYINTIEAKKKTAGKIAGDLKSLFSRVFDPVLRSKIIPFADEFEIIVSARNGLIHGKPGTTCEGDQRLFRDGDVLTIDVINAFSDRCVRAALPLNDLLYAELACGANDVVLTD